MSPRTHLSIALAAFALAGCNAPTSFIEPHELGSAAQQVASLAGEAEWLAQQLREGSVTQNMAWVHQQAIGDDAVKIAERLAKPVPPELRATHEALAQLDTRLASQVSRIAPAAQHPDELAALEREFHILAAQAQPMGESS